MVNLLNMIGSSVHLELKNPLSELRSSGGKRCGSELKHLTHTCSHTQGPARWDSQPLHAPEQQGLGHNMLIWF